ncbi:MAG: PAS/PAC sensor protein [Gallionellaceae bacterium]|nr:MAG: PAS/PAC sensor protein [Gallionellaceae bacterium]
MRNLSTFLNTPARVVFAVGMIILVIESLIMLLIEAVPSSIVPDEKWQFLDPILLTTIVSPILYFLIYRPLNQQALLEQQLDELQRFQKVVVGRELRMKELAEENLMLRSQITTGDIGESASVLPANPVGSDAEGPVAEIGETKAEQRNILLFMLEDLETARNKIEQAQQEWMVALDVVSDPIFLHDREFRILRANHAYAARAGMSIDEFIGKPYYQIFPKHAGPLASCLRALRMVREEVEELTLESGEIIRSRASPVYDVQGEYLHSIHILEDITERKASEAEIRRLTQLYAALSQCNEAIVRCTSEDELFPQICRDSVEFGGMKMAWIGLTDDETGMVSPVASYGKGIEFLDDILISVDADNPTGHSPIGIAIRDNRPQWCQDFQNDTLTAPWRERGASFDWGSLASLPLVCNGVVVGAFTLYSGATNNFDEAARKLLVEMAADISFALDGFERDARRKQAEQELAESEQHFHSLFENMLEGYAYCKMLFKDGVAEEFIYLEVNRAFETLTGLKDVSGKRASEAIPGIRESNPELFEIYGRVAQNGLPQQFEMYVSVLDRWFAVSVYCPENEYFVAIFDNITERKQSERVLAESELRFRGLVEQSLAGIYIIQDGRFVYVNPRFAEIFGYAATSELIGVEPALLVAEQDRSLVTKNIRSRLEGEEQSISYGFTAVRKDGSLIDVGVHGARATHLGRPAILGLMQDVSEKKHAEEQIQRYVRQLEDSFLRTIEVATTLVEMRDPYTAGHEKRVAQIAVAIGTEMGLDAHHIEGLRVGGYIHDIGKIIIPAEILCKPSRLNQAEYELIKGHPQAGYDILKNVSFPWPVADIAYQHHERMDGSGYPRGLKGEEILLEARITAVADVVEAMSSHRPYRPGLGIEPALAEIERGSGTAFDPEVVSACLCLFREKSYQLPV